MDHQQRGNAILDPAWKSKLNDIEQLMAELSENPRPFNDLMREHLEAARSYLLDSALEEYGLSLQLAREVLPNIEDEVLRTRIADFLEDR